MTTRVAINGFGRIGRLVLRTLLARYKKDLAVIAINDMADLKTKAHLFRYDSTYGIYPGTVETSDATMTVDGREIAVLNQKDPSRLPWRQLVVDIVIEATRASKRRRQKSDRYRACQPRRHYWPSIRDRNRWF
jgi:glyceraldehyde 3-phosphate dehydrogenase